MKLFPLWIFGSLINFNPDSTSCNLPTHDEGRFVDINCAPPSLDFVQSDAIYYILLTLPWAEPPEHMLSQAYDNLNSYDSLFWKVDSEAHPEWSVLLKATSYPTLKKVCIVDGLLSISTFRDLEEPPIPDNTWFTADWFLLWQYKINNVLSKYTCQGVYIVKDNRQSPFAWIVLLIILLILIKVSFSV